MSDLPRLSKNQALFRNFEGSVWNTEKFVVRTQNIDGNPVNRPEIARVIAREISELIKVEDEHYSFKRQRRAERARVPKKEEVSREDYAEIEAQLRELRGEEGPEILSEKEPAEFKARVDAYQIDLIEITDNSIAHVDIFPRSYRCYTCGHYEIIDPRTVKDLKCPCCKGYCPNCEESVEEPVDEKCPKCGTKLRRNYLEQYAYIFVCPRCANIEEFTPAIIRLDDVRGRVITCPQCGKGHFHFRIKESFTTAFWQCTNPGCQFVRRTGRNRLNKFCKCHIPHGPNNEEGRYSIMKPIVTSAPSIAYPLVKTYLYLGTNPLTLGDLQLEHQKSKGVDKYEWRLSEKVSSLDLKMISDIYGIMDAFTVPKIVTSTVVYGYKSNVSSHPVRINDNERMAKLFGTRQRFKAYLTNTEGRALVIMLNKGKILDYVKSVPEFRCDPNISYEDATNNIIAYLTTGQFQLIIDNPDAAGLVTLLHALEHAYFKSAVEQVGLEIFGSKILVTDCAILLYEREDVGEGGLVQLTSGAEAVGFKRLLRQMQTITRICPQLCHYACPACIYIHDFYCQPFVPSEMPRWFPPNALLNRTAVDGFFNFLSSNVYTNRR